MQADSGGSPWWRTARVAGAVLCGTCTASAAPGTAPAPAPPVVPHADSRVLEYKESGGMLQPVAPPSGAGAKARPALPPPKPEPAAPPAVRKPVAHPATPARPREVPRVAPATPACAGDAPCNEEARLSALERAQVATDSALFDAMLQREASAGRTAEGERRYRRMRLARLMARHAGSAAQGARERAEILSREAGPLALSLEEGDVALRLGTLWLEAGDPAAARGWFERARAWSGRVQAAATAGLARAAIAQGDPETALRHAETLPSGGERSALRRDALLALALQADASGRREEVAARLRAAASEGPLPPAPREQLAWTLLALGERPAAAVEFAGLYREAPGRAVAEGLLAAVGDPGSLDPQLAASEPMAGLLRTRGARDAFGARRFLEAQRADPQGFGDAGAITTAWAGVGGGWRDKTGTPGLAQLRVTSGPAVEVQSAPFAASVLRARVERSRLDAGSYAADVPWGSALAATARPLQRVDVDAAQLAIRHDAGVVYEATLARVAANGPLGSRASASLEVAGTPAWGQWSALAFTLPVRESVLASAGLTDPSTGMSWGRVFRDGLEVRGLWLRASPWSVGLAARAARLDGVGVASNRQRAIEIAAGYDLRLPGFAYAAASVAAGDESYSRNLAHFTLGHGGYFSPQRYRRVGAAFDFMTAERRPWMLRGRVALGRVEKREDAAAFFPLAEDGRFHEGSRSRDYDASAQLAGVLAVSRHLQLAFGLARGVAPQYRESVAFAQLRILLDGRGSAVSADLPRFGP